MKPFITKTLLFLFLIFLSIEVFSFFLVSLNLHTYYIPGRSIYHSIDKSKERRSVNKLLLGDSVGRQLFSNDTNDEFINSLACNQAIGMVGQFILLNNYLQVNKEIDTVYMVLTPFSFRNNLDQDYTYHYFLKPFHKMDYSALFTEVVNDQINKIPYSNFIRTPHILATSWAPIFEPKDVIEYTFLSPISVEYLHKIKQLSVSENFKLIILPTPVNINRKELIDEMNIEEIAFNNLSSEFVNYFENIIYLDSTYFFEDGTHLKNPSEFTKYYKSNLFRKP